MIEPIGGLQSTIERLIDELVPVRTLDEIIDASCSLLGSIPAVTETALCVVDDDVFTVHRFGETMESSTHASADESDPIVYRLAHYRTHLIDVENPDPAPPGFTDACWHEPYEESLRRGVREILWVPAVSGGRTLGALWFSSADRGVFDDAEFRDQLEVVTATLSMAMAKVEALARVDRRVRAIDQTHDELETVNRDLQDFAQMASSGLGDPLRKLMAFGDRLEASAVDDLTERELDYLARIHSASSRMRRLIDDLLLFSSVHTPDAAPETVDLDDVLDGVLSDLEVAIAESDAVIESNSLGTVSGNPTQLRQLLQNLIGNAIKFRADGLAPHITVRRTGDTPARIEVSDNGIGFDPRFLDRIFKPFQRLHAKTEFEGSGIGLSVCRRIAERHGGELQATSVQGEGSTFIATLEPTSDGGAP